MKKTASLLAAIICLVSCTLEPATFPVSEMVSINNGVVTDDTGLRYNISNIDQVPKILTLERAYVQGQATRENENPAFDYELKVEACYSVSVKNAVAASASPEGYGNSPVSMQVGWFAGGYFNMLVAVSYLTTEGYKGEINLVYDDARSTATDVYFELKNKQDGRTWEDTTMTEREVEFGQEYYSFRYLDLIPKDAKGNIKVHISWKWFDANNLDPEAKVPLHSVSEKSDICEITIQ